MYSNADIRSIWAEFIDGLVGASGPLARPANLEYTESLLGVSCGLLHIGIPVANQTWEIVGRRCFTT